MTFDPWLLLAVAGTFVLAGTVKGVVGMGLPTVSLALLTAMVGLQPAMAVLLAPTMAANLWQALVGGYLVEIVRRLWVFLLASAVTTWLGVLVRSEERRVGKGWEVGGGAAD